jgi:hypothetical protein
MNSGAKTELEQGHMHPFTIWGSDIVRAAFGEVLMLTVGLL